MAYRILIVDDEPALRDGLRLNLELDGYNCITASSGVEALRIVKEERFDLVVLDIMMPDLDGIAVCESMLLLQPNLPVLFLSAKGSSIDKVAGLKAGARDYLSKPFNLEELQLRVANMLKAQEAAQRTTAPSNDSIAFGNNLIFFERQEAETPAGVLPLTKTELLLLRFFSEHPDEVISRERLLQRVWGYDVYPNSRSIDNFILNLRKYFEVDPRNPRFFHSIRGVGYKFTPKA